MPSATGAAQLWLDFDQQFGNRHPSTDAKMEVCSYRTEALIHWASNSYGGRLAGSLLETHYGDEVKAVHCCHSCTLRERLFFFSKTG